MINPDAQEVEEQAEEQIVEEEVSPILTRERQHCLLDFSQEEEGEFE